MIHKSSEGTLDQSHPFNPLKNFEAHSAAWPDSVALMLEDDLVSYQWLNRRVNQLAHYLQKKGVGPETIVGVCLDRSFALISGILGVIKAGGSVLPLEPSYPRNRIALMLKDSKPSLILCHSQYLDLFSDSPVPLVCLNESWSAFLSESSENPKNHLSVGNLRVVFYTSGSTGNPKGVMLAHRETSQSGALGLLTQNSATPDLVIDREDRVLVKCPISFAPFFWEVLEPLSAGGTLVLSRPGGTQDFQYLLKTILERSITVAHFVPSALRVFLEQQLVESCTGLRHVLCSGEVLSCELRNLFFSRLEADLHVTYAATETPGAARLHLHRGNRTCALTIGRGRAGKVYVLNDWYEQVEIGDNGEVYAEVTDGFRGYLGRPDQTAEKFLPNPLSSKAGSRLHKTGDRGCYLSEGEIKFLGRNDSQVKLRGFRIELGEIEAILSTHPGIIQNVVMLHEAVQESMILAAYFVPSLEEPVPDKNELSLFLKKSLPDYMVPNVFVALEEFPLTLNGKIDRKALSLPVWEPREENGNYIPPQTLLEVPIAEVWREILGIEQISVEDNFFGLGGDSLQMMVMIGRLEKKIGLRLHIKEVWFQPMNELAKLCEEKILELCLENCDKSQSQRMVIPPLIIK
ncbi:MAG: non-ribosomal peptide synthetase [Nitrospirota bacterium]|nr:non-ribosomal peptide synthetase [Nitrospirota bacterium]MDX2421016.1 non-ribosomal peptide synthetase [Nitrospirota bacterium]